VEDSDCILLLGAMLTDIDMGIYTANLDPAKCIYVTAVPFTDESRKDMIAGGLVVDVIQKPFDNEDLVTRIKKLLGV
ncbi:MAG: hypothetical protein NTU61_06090, partial [Candidatus Altiarchaeota archaeon]|nr:hypothetical protein [Candidatus Altiarchaeota archaeon]